MNDLAALRRLERAHHQRVAQSLKVKAQIIDVYDAAANLVRVSVPSLRQTKVVHSLITKASTWVWIEEQPDHVFAVTDVAVADSSEVYASSLAEVVLPPTIGSALALNVSAAGLTFGRVGASDLGGLYVHVGAFWYDSDYYDDGSADRDPTAHDFSLSAYVPAVSGCSGWVLVWFDPSDATFGVAAQAPGFGSAALLREDTMDLSVVPSGCYPLGAVGLDYGQTAITAASRFASTRLLLSPTFDPARIDARLLELLHSARQTSRMGAMGYGLGRHPNEVVMALLKRPFGRR